MMWTEGGQPAHLTFAGLRGGSKGGGGGGGGGGQSINFSQSNIPAWLDTAAQGAVGQAQGLANRPYTPYGGQTVAQPGDATNNAYWQIWNMQGQTDPAFAASQGAYQNLLGQAAPQTAAGQTGLTNLLNQNFQQNVYDPAYRNILGATTGTAGLLGGYLQNIGPATAGQVIGNAQQFMSPYTQAVINPAMQLGQQALAQNLQQIGAGANQAGAFGGSRQGVQEGVAQAQTSLGESAQIGNLLNQGWQSALTPAYNLANQASQQGYNAANIMAQMYYGGAQGLNSLLSGGYGAAQQQAATMNAANQQQGMVAAQQLPAEALAQQQAQQRQASLMQTIGAAQQNQQQQELNAQLGQFYEQQDWPVQNLDTLLAAVGGVPYGTTSLSYGRTEPDAPKKNMAGSVIGGALTGGAQGFMVGGPWGAGIGAVGGGILGALN